MKIPPPLLQAAGDVAQEAFELAGHWAADNPAADAGRLFDAVQHFNAVYHETMFPRQGRSRTSSSGAVPPARFDAAIRIVDPGAFEPAIIAQAILSACEELTDDDPLGGNDDAVRLMATQLAIVCRVSTDLKASTHLMLLCTRRASKT